MGTASVLALGGVTGGVVAELPACNQHVGVPAEPSAVISYGIDAAAAEAGPPPLPNVVLKGVVRGERSVDGGGLDAGRSDGGDAAVSVPESIVIAEIGGLDQAPSGGLGPDGQRIPTLGVDPFVRAGALVGPSGDFTLSLPPGTTGLRVLSPNFAELTKSITSPFPDPVTLSLTPVTALVRQRPIATGLSANLPPGQTAVAPLAPITIAVEVTAGTPADPLSSDVFVLQPATHWAGVLAPPVPALAGGPYPDGVYNREVEAPATPGLYRYVVVAASVTKVTSVPVAIHIVVTADGMNPEVDAGFGEDGGVDAEDFVDGGGLPDGRM
jgi:hypothetical protein